MMQFTIWYMKPDWFRDGNVGRKPDPANLTATHVQLKTIDIEGANSIDRDGATALERIFYMMQGENWSPNGEARELIRSKGLQHTSMSVGDVAVDPAGDVYVVASFGFENLSAVDLVEDGGASA